MKTCWPCQLLSTILVLSFSLTTLGVDAPSVPKATLRASGTVQVNGTRSREITTLFPDDLIQTGEDSVANITAAGSSLLVMPNASVKYLGKVAEISEGGVAIATSDGMAATVDGLTITPAAQELSKFEVVEREDSVVIAARQGNLTVTDGQQSSTVQEGQETTRKKKKRGAGADVGNGSGHALSGKTLGIIGGASGATVAGILIAESNKKKKCVSSSNDKKCKCKKDTHGNEDCEE